MAQVLDWYSVTLSALQRLWEGLINFIPQFIGALVIFGVGWIIAVGVSRLVSELLKRVNFNQLFDRGGWKEALEKAEIKVDASDFVGAIFKWVLVIVFLLAAVDILGFRQFAVFLQNILGYLPNVIVAVLIFAVTVVVVDIVEKIVRAAVGGVRIGYAHVAGSLAKWAIWIFAILAILRQLLIVPNLVDVLFGALVYGVVGFLVISLGLSFGLGGKEVAADILHDFKRKLRGD
ncbi:MAG: hypothetical protein A2667_00550 [Candidatus Wildermuthbacteria bacterium RIFCSPHIGHO2_01_FULL_47_27]|uniref:Small-conductance mechanosensitive ion channel n=1 Tax=Candidatus Wildermuthbacteria bacterium RIFCSPHIGHO2_02_FULL_47_17 TaxID=1802452 RepID=A0A1G2R591_9BACT|nr:MAG: Small-conductance mechanosensitive ion channel-like protein [Parcubacteria group bacterium GW2011_GWA2_47_9]OHA64216.1 MAG: hypothetical protein A2667_00550 [Candidatus Wildermuthbacteria bacterium RIFCSPHIGHO2_01_FULL_47_27]OHA67983.1 MAG: hypothetical protein A3D59_02505 [Candidatus Wildermuthbacteria bacterium RIFCSPHIGHO2_02_FULL_47_17]